MTSLKIKIIIQLQVLLRFPKCLVNHPRNCAGKNLKLTNQKLTKVGHLPNTTNLKAQNYLTPASIIRLQKVLAN